MTLTMISRLCQAFYSVRDSMLNTKLGTAPKIEFVAQWTRLDLGNSRVLWFETFCVTAL